MTQKICTLLFFLSILIAQNLCAQTPDAKAILKKSIKKCANIKNGSYGIQYFEKKYNNDSINRKATIVFDRKGAEMTALKSEDQNSINFASDKLGTFQLFLRDSSYTFIDTNV